MTDIDNSINSEVQTDSEGMLSPESEIRQQEFAVPAIQSVYAPQATETPHCPAPVSVKKSPNKMVIGVVSSVLLIAAVILFIVFGLPAIRYSNGIKAFDNGEYTKAVDFFGKLDDYKDSDEYLAQAELGVHYNNAGILVQEGKYAEAIEEYKLAQDFLDAKARLKDTYILYGDELLAQGKYDKAIAEYQHADAPGKIAEAYNLKGEELFQQEKYVHAAEAFAAANNEERQLDCAIRLIEDQKDYTAALTILENKTSTDAVSYSNYANGMLSLEASDYKTAINFFASCTGLLDANARKEEATFLLAEKCLHDGYLNKALALYTSLPDDYSHNNILASDRIDLLNRNKRFLDLVGTWNATYNYYKVQADSSYYYYYWYQDTAYMGTVTVTCPYNDDGTFTIKGTATFPSYQNFSTYSSQLITKLETFTFSTNCNAVPYQIASSSTTKLTFNGSYFSIEYKHVDNYSNLYWSYTYTSNARYTSRTMLADDK